MKLFRLPLPPGYIRPLADYAGQAATATSPQRARMAVQQLGVMLLLTLIVVIFYNDIMRIVR